MKVIFLDFNGILDTYYDMDVISDCNLNRLKKIVDATDAKVVISSSIKNSYYYLGHFNNICKYLLNTLENVGIDVIGITPYRDSREQEINDYLKDHKGIESFCILEDDYDIKSLEENLVKLPMQSEEYPYGIQDEHVEKAIKILKK